jgi:hypothetical protein
MKRKVSGRLNHLALFKCLKKKITCSILDNKKAKTHIIKIISSID